MKYVVISLGIFVCFASFLNAEDVTYYASQDTEIDEYIPGLNFGDEPVIEVYADWEDPPTLIAKCLFQFQVDLESWAIIDEAVLQLHVVANTLEPGPIAIFVADGTWNEMSVTWITRPQENRINEIQMDAPPVIVDPVLWEIDVTEIVREWVSGYPNNGFYLDVPDYNNWVGVDLATKEHSNPDLRPKLWIDYWYNDVTEDVSDKVSLSVVPVSNRSITIDYSLPSSLTSELSIYDASGSVVETLVARSGNHSVFWNSTPGVYFFRMDVGNRVICKKAIVLK